jgi:hypothetical protein
LKDYSWYLQGHPDHPVFLPVQTDPAWATDATTYLDVLGPEVAIAFSDSDRFKGTSSAGRRHWTVIEQQRGGFALRIFAGRAGTKEVAKGVPRFGYAEQSTPALRALTVTIPDATAAAGATATALAHLSTDRVALPVWDLRRGTPRRIVAGSPNESIEFVYPPGPPTRGVNVFGDIESVSLNTSDANLRAGPTERTINAPTNIELTDVALTATQDRSLVGLHVPFQLAGREARVQASLSGEVLLDGTKIPSRSSNPVVRSMSALSDARLVYWIALGTLVAAIASLRATRREGAPRPRRKR